MHPFLLRASLGLLACLFMPVSALAIINPCFSIGGPTAISSDGTALVHPQQGDNIWFAVTVDNLFEKPYVGPPQMVLVRVAGQGNVFSVDVVVTTDATPFPDYRAATLSGDPSGELSAIGSLGPLQAGDYIINGSVHVYNASTQTLDLACLPGQQSRQFTIFSSPGVAPVIEFYNAHLDHYFITQNADEIRDLDTGVHPGWARTGQSFLAYLPGQSTLARIERFYGLPAAGLDTHFYTYGASPDAVSLLVGPLSGSWELETDDAFELYMASPASGACPANTVPVYRLWNDRTDSNHRYTTDASTRDDMVARGYIAEGWGNDVVFMCALSGTR